VARPSRRLIDALRATARRLEDGARYEWGHMGRCNCGHLAQTLTTFTPEQIHRMAMVRFGNWNEQVREYCPSSGFQMDLLIDLLMDAGLDRDDLCHLENLSDTQVLSRLPIEERDLQRNHREHTIRYVRAWADALESAIPSPLPAPLLELCAT